MQILLGSTRSTELLRRMAALSWGRLFAAEIPTPERREPWALDNGVFGAWKGGRDWCDAAFVNALHRAERRIACDRIGRPLFAVLPDIVASAQSLDFSLAWHARVGRLFDVPWYLVVQNGFSADDVRAAVKGRNLAGIFLGGDDAFKATAGSWCSLAHELGVRFHFARVSTPARLRAAHAIGADSCDTTQPLWSEQCWRRFEGAARSLSSQLVLCS
jgi:hypothetical protein